MNTAAAYLVVVLLAVASMRWLVPRVWRRRAIGAVIALALLFPVAFEDGVREVVSRRTSAVAKRALRVPGDVLSAMFEAVIRASGVPTTTTTSSTTTTPP